MYPGLGMTNSSVRLVPNTETYSNLQNKLHILKILKVNETQQSIETKNVVVSLYYHCVIVFEIVKLFTPLSYNALFCVRNKPEQDIQYLNGTMCLSLDFAHQDLSTNILCSE